MIMPPSNARTVRGQYRRIRGIQVRIKGIIQVIILGDGGYK